MSLGSFPVEKALNFWVQSHLEDVYWKLIVKGVALATDHPELIQLEMLVWNLQKKLEKTVDRVIPKQFPMMQLALKQFPNVNKGGQNNHLDEQNNLHIYYS